MAICNFDGPNKVINILSPTTFATVQDIYDESVEWSDEQENMEFHCPLEASGYAPIGGGVYTDKIFKLMYGWKIKPWSGTFQLRIQGSLVTDDESERSILPDYGNVQLVFEVATAGVVTVTGSGVTQQDKEDIADLVETQTGVPIKAKTNLIPADPATVTKQNTIIADILRLLKIEEGRWKIDNNQLIIYEPDGVTVYKRFNLKNKLGQPTEESPYERVPV